MAEEDAEELRSRALSYAVPADGAGMRHFRRRRRLARVDFARAAEELMTWQVHERAGLSVACSAPVVAVGEVVQMRLGWRGVAVRIPCRVVSAVDEPHRCGFAYGTLVGHPESGEERFWVERDGDGAVTFTIEAFSRPASTLARWGGPATRLLQDHMTSRYLRALDR